MMGPTHRNNATVMGPEPSRINKLVHNEWHQNQSRKKVCLLVHRAMATNNLEQINLLFSNKPFSV